MQDTNLDNSTFAEMVDILQIHQISKVSYRINCTDLKWLNDLLCLSYMTKVLKFMLHDG
jgi:hypothetical protein